MVSYRCLNCWQLLEGSLWDESFIIDLEEHNEKCGRKGFEVGSGLHLNIG